MDLIHLILDTSPLLIYLLVALILLLESSAIPIANTTVLLVAGALASLGHLNIYVLAVAAILGSITGACLAYLLGIRGGRQVLLRLASRFHVDPQKVSIAESWFQQSGTWMVFFSRMTPYVRPFACFPCGISRMPFRRFFIAALFGSMIWCIGILSIGWMLGPRWTLAIHLIQTYTLLTIVVLILLIALSLLLQLTVKRYLQSKLPSARPSENHSDQCHTRDLIEM